ncbi:hypothetical protein [Candidatus Uabimicrobium amorphum]|uniref:Arylesterase n=1 Tax=Uabimicrobium amorphum TaxID=2596890 RepID=A0A5S9IRM1_UABAM|nr:hypothetical protein [Candidatus Uabimicrobium amorphum]BBM85425.1 arylesterase [Candidatus Uabimicrobium amorphum]
MKILWLFLVLCTACSTARLINHTASKYHINVGPGPEDIQYVSIDDRPHLLVSCLERREKYQQGDFWLINLTTDEAKRVERCNEPMGLIFRPHGIYIYQSKTQKKSFDVYVVHHGFHGDNTRGKGIYGHAILKYEWRDGLLHYQRSFNHPFLINPNDIFVVGDDCFYVTNGYLEPPQGFGQLFGFCERSTVVHYNKGKWVVAAKDLEYANGVHYVSQQKKFLVSASASGKLWSYKRHPQTGILQDKQLLAENLGGGDNFTQNSDTTLLASHVDTTKFFLHSLSPRVSSPTMVWRIDWKTHTIDCIYRNNGGESINGGSTAVLYNKKLYICQVFEPFIEVVDLRHRDFSTSYGEVKQLAH